MLQCLARRVAAATRVKALRIERVLGAARRGEYHLLKWCFETGRAWVTDLTTGETALHAACAGASKRCAKLCLRQGMDINGYDGRGLTPLHAAATSMYQGRELLMHYLIDHGAWHEAADFEGNTPAMAAAAAGNADSVRALLLRAADTARRNNDGRAALHLAARGCHREAAEALLRGGLTLGGTDPNARDDEGATALHEAATHGFAAVADVLLDGPDGPREVGRLFPEDKPPWAPSDWVDPYAKGDDDEDGGDDDDGDDAEEISAAEVAAGDALRQAARDDALRAAVPDHQRRPGADINAVDNEGYSPLAYAAAANEPALCELLLRRGADATLADAQGRTVLHFAAQEGYAECIDAVLVEGDVFPTPLDVDGETPLHAAAQGGHEAAFAALLRGGCDALVVSVDGDQAAHVVAEAGHVGMMRLLMDYDVDIDVRNNEGRTPMGCASMAGRTDIVALIRENYRVDVWGGGGGGGGSSGGGGEGAGGAAGAQAAQEELRKRARTTVEWEAMRARSGAAVLTIGDWSEYKDGLTQACFFHDGAAPNTSEELPPLPGTTLARVVESHGYTWDEPIEIACLVGPPWEVIRGDGKAHLGEELRAAAEATGSTGGGAPQQRTKPRFRHTGTGEIRDTPPPPDGYRLRLLAQARRRRLRKLPPRQEGHEREGALTVVDYQVT